MKTILVAGKRVKLTRWSKEDETEVLGATVQMKGLGSVKIEVTRQDPEKFKKLVEFLAVPHTAIEIQKEFGLKTWSAAGRLIDAAKASGVKVHVRRTEVGSGLGRRPMLFSVNPIGPDVLPAAVPRKNELVTVLTKVMDRLEALEQRFPAPEPSPNGHHSTPPPPSH